MDRSEYVHQLHSRYGVSRPEIVHTIEEATGNSVANITRIIRGDEYEVHRVHLGDHSTVYLRATFPGTQTSKAEHEAWAMSCARNNGVPVPEVLSVSAIDDHDGPRSAMVVRACSGQPLAEVLASLRLEQRSTALNNIGQVLAVLHSIPMPGIGRPNTDGSWPDPDQERDRYLTDISTAVHQLRIANFSLSEIDRVRHLLQQDRPTVERPVLCHGDISPEHVFVDADLNVVGLIDWGMWTAGPAVAELAGLAVRLNGPDYSAIATGHGQRDTHPNSMRWHAIAQLVHQIDWLVSSKQTDELEQPATALRKHFP